MSSDGYIPPTGPSKKKKKKKKKKFFNFDLPDVLPEIPHKMNFYRSMEITKDRKFSDGYIPPTGPSKKKKKKK